MPADDRSNEGDDDRHVRFRPAIDAHTHLFPERLTEAIRRALSDEAGWSFSHPTARPEIEDVLSEAGVSTYVALPYVHEASLATELNEWLCAQAARSDRLVPFATVHPDDEDVGDVVRRAFEDGARGLKFHCPVQECTPADPRLEPALETAAAFDRPVTYHGGTAPMFEDSPYVGADVFEDVVASYPDLRVCCAHMGTYEVDRFLEFAREYDNVYLDTTFAMSTSAEETMGFDPSTIPDETFVELSESIMYGSDFPNVPYPYRNERVGLLDRDLPADVARDVFYRTAADYLGLDFGSARA
ncbi:amidohydrolase family protein [Natribaculum luteum]|uniref:Amidohydrolase family protein n=1 Tax=Natribaculum luteum TaxID=1586232 RepID=A0ABD5P266_9EURY|nr:amidohydrolase family protein [Natribaculum luteum]